MKKKLLLAFLSVLIVSITVITSLFIFMVKYKYQESLLDRLRGSNKLIINLIETENITDLNEFFKEDFKDGGIRATYIDKNGKVLYDSMEDAETMENHKNREEVIKAKASGEGHSIRNSTTTGKRQMYLATLLKDGSVIRSSVIMEQVNAFEGDFLKYYIFVVFSVTLAAILVAITLSNNIVKPVKELMNTTRAIERGELTKRVTLSTGDEIGELGETFNKMAYKLELNMKEVTENRNKLEAILKSMDSGVVAVDAKNKVIMINPYAEEIFGLKKNIIGLNLMDCIRNFEIENILLIDTLEDYKEVKLLHPRERILRIRTAAIVNEGKNIGKVAVLQDITKVKELENMRQSFVANVSHELKTPLTSIKGFAETLSYVDDPINKDKFLNIINDEADRLTRLINDILTLSSIESGLEDREEEVNLNKKIEEVVHILKPQAKTKEISIKFTGDELPPIIGNGDQVLQMLINLVENAIKYNRPQGSVTIVKLYEKPFCIIKIADTGYGIPKEHHGRIFERFYRVDKARSRAEGGTGLGLAIVKHIVLSLKGTIELESEMGVGSTFIIKIPVRGTERDIFYPDYPDYPDCTDCPDRTFLKQV